MMGIRGGSCSRVAFQSAADGLKVLVKSIPE